jgi:hypothetical protein
MRLGELVAHLDPKTNSIDDAVSAMTGSIRMPTGATIK